ncbi:hypothetical protein GCM10023204_43590 [Actinomycetospora succinea]
MAVQLRVGEHDMVTTVATHRRTPFPGALRAREVDARLFASPPGGLRQRTGGALHVSARRATPPKAWAERSGGAPLLMCLLHSWSLDVGEPAQAPRVQPGSHRFEATDLGKVE